MASNITITDDRGSHHGIDRSVEAGEQGGEVMAYVLLRHRDIPDINKIDVYKKNGGFAAFKKAVTKMQPTK
jgi:hypothetical protein